MLVMSPSSLLELLHCLSHAHNTITVTEPRYLHTHHRHTIPYRRPTHYMVTQYGHTVFSHCISTLYGHTVWSPCSHRQCIVTGEAVNLRLFSSRHITSVSLTVSLYNHCTTLATASQYLHHHHYLQSGTIITPSPQYQLLHSVIVPPSPHHTHHHHTHSVTTINRLSLSPHSRLVHTVTTRDFHYS